MGVGAFDRYTLPKDGKITEKSCNIFKIFFDAPKLTSFKILDHQKQKISEISEVKNSKKNFFFIESSNMILQTYYECQMFFFEFFKNVRSESEYEMCVEDFTSIRKRSEGNQRKSQRKLRNSQGKESRAASDNFSYLYSLTFMSR